jgi:hypothetical protein
VLPNVADVSNPDFNGNPGYFCFTPKSGHSKSNIMRTSQIRPQTFGSHTEMKQAQPMYRPAKPLEELALDLLFESYGESRYNRTVAEYERLSALVKNLKDAHFRVNRSLEQCKKSDQPRWDAICYFKAGDLTPRYAPLPESISMETIRNALVFSGFREPRRRKRAT